MMIEESSLPGYTINRNPILMISCTSLNKYAEESIPKRHKQYFILLCLNAALRYVPYGKQAVNIKL